MQFGRNKTLIDRAQDYVDQISDTVLPQLEAAWEQAVDKAGPALADARDKATPLLAEGKAVAAEKASAGAAVAAERASAGAHLAADKAAAGAAIAAALAAEKAAAGRDLASAKVAELKGEPEPKGGKLKKLVLITGLAAAAAFVASRLRGGKESENWQSSYSPTPAPTPAPTPVATAVPDDDEGGATPSEAISDSAESPHPVTTPDEPADVVEVDEQK